MRSCHLFDQPLFTCKIHCCITAKSVDATCEAPEVNGARGGANHGVKREERYGGVEHNHADGIQSAFPGVLDYSAAALCQI